MEGVSDPFTGANRYVPGQVGESSVVAGQDPFTGYLSLTTYVYTPTVSNWQEFCRWFKVRSRWRKVI